MCFLEYKLPKYSLSNINIYIQKERGEFNKNLKGNYTQLIAFSIKLKDQKFEFKVFLSFIFIY